MVTTDGVAMVTSREYIIAYATTAYNLSGPTKGSPWRHGHAETNQHSHDTPLGQVGRQEPGTLQGHREGQQSFLPSPITRVSVSTAPGLSCVPPGTLSTKHHPRSQETPTATSGNRRRKRIRGRGNRVLPFPGPRTSVPGQV